MDEKHYKQENKSVNKLIIDNLYANREIRVYNDYSPTLRSERFGLLVLEEINDNETD